VKGLTVPPMYRAVIGLWAGWAAAIICFQALVQARLTVAGPDRAGERDDARQPGRQALP